MSTIQEIISSAKVAAESRNADYSTIGYLGYFAAVIAISSLGSVAKMLGDHTGKITARVLWTYLVTGITSGLILALLTIERHGGSLLLVGICGVAGFGSVQILSVLSQGLQSVIRRIFGSK